MAEPERFASIEDIKIRFFPNLWLKEQREARERREAEPDELDQQESGG